MFSLLREIAYAQMRHDASFFERVLDDDYVGTGPDGETRNKAERIADVKRLDCTIKKFEFDDLHVSGNGEMAFATFLGTVSYQANGQDSTAQYRYTVNFIKKDVPLDGDKMYIRFIPDERKSKGSGETEVVFMRGIPAAFLAELQWRLRSRGSSTRDSMSATSRFTLMGISRSMPTTRTESFIFLTGN